MSGNMTVDAPYNFVPLSETVVDTWEETAPNDVPSHDIPYSDGISGEVTFDIIADPGCPLLVAGGDQSDKVKRFFRGPDTLPAIPGSALRGMIRNVVEIASFSRFKLVEDRRLGLRDLTGAAQEYTNRLTETVNGAYRSRAHAGWLSLGADGTWQITPCDFARVEHQDIETVLGHGGDFESKIRKKRPPLDCRVAYSLYKSLELPASAWVDDQETEYRHSADKKHPNGKRLFYKKAHPAEEKDTEKKRGHIVFTGAPNRNKHLEFFFFDPRKGKAVDVPPDVVAGFLSVHEEQEKPNENWNFWRQSFSKGKVSRIPVFYICDDNGEIEAMGLSMMFKMAQRNSIMDLIRRNFAAHIDETESAEPDLAERLFGRVSTKPEQSFKGRVSFGLATLRNPDTCKEDGPHETVLSGPKPSWFPAYLEQGRLAKSGLKLAKGSDSYRTYMADDGRPRGWKRYPVRATEDIESPPPKPSADVGEKSRTKLKPIIATSESTPLTFSATMRFHNLRPWELGALIWSLTWGGDEAARHRLGMGKPFGWGQVRLTCRDARIRHNKRDEAGKTGVVTGVDALASVTSTRSEFESAMSEKVPNWEETRQVRSLLAMACVQTQKPHALRHPKLAMRGNNEFSDLKKIGAILPYWGIEPPGLPDPDLSTGGNPNGTGDASGSSTGAAARPGIVFAEGTWVTDGDEVFQVLRDVQDGEPVVSVIDRFGSMEHIDVSDVRKVEK